MGEFHETESAVLEQLHGNVEEMSGRGNPPGTVFPENRDFGLVGRARGTVGTAQAADGVKFLGKLGARGIVKAFDPELRAARHGPGLDAAVARVQAAVERCESRTRLGPVKRAGRAPPQRVFPSFVAAEIVVHFTGLGAVVGAHLQHLASYLPAPLDTQRLGLAGGKALQEGRAVKQERLLEGFFGGHRKGHSVGHLGIGPTRPLADSEGLVVDLLDAVGGQELPS